MSETVIEIDVVDAGFSSTQLGKATDMLAVGELGVVNTCLGGLYDGEAIWGRKLTPQVLRQIIHPACVPLPTLQRWNFGEPWVYRILKAAGQLEGPYEIDGKDDVINWTDVVEEPSIKSADELIRNFWRYNSAIVSALAGEAKITMDPFQRAIGMYTESKVLRAALCRGIYITEANHPLFN